MRGIANIVTEQLKEGNHGMIRLVVTGKGLDVGLNVVRIATIDGNILEITEVALVATNDLLVDGAKRIERHLRIVLDISSVGRVLRKIELVAQNREEVRVSREADGARSDPIDGNAEVSTGRVSNDGNSALLALGAQDILPSSTRGRLNTRDAVAREISSGRGGLPASGIGLRIPIIAITSAPVSSAISTSARVKITIEIDKGKMRMTKVMAIRRRISDGGGSSGASSTSRGLISDTILLSTKPFLFGNRDAVLLNAFGHSFLDLGVDIFGDLGVLSERRSSTIGSRVGESLRREHIASGSGQEMALRGLVAEGKGMADHVRIFLHNETRDEGTSIEIDEVLTSR